MDEEIVDSASGHDTVFSVSKPKKKIATAKKKAGKEAEQTKPKAAPSSKKANKEAVPAKKVNKEALARKENKEAEPSKKKTTLDLVCEAIEVSGDSRKGLSVQAIKKYVTSNIESAAANLNYNINKALSKGIETGRLERPPASKEASGATGYFRLAKVKPLKRTKPVARGPKKSEHASDSEATEKPVKPRKRNLSDTYISEMRASLTSTPKPEVKTAATLKDAKQTKKVPKKDLKNKKDTSDSKIMVKETKRKAVKSYSSDTELDLKKIKTTKPTKVPVKKTPSEKAKTAKAGSPIKESKAKVKKLYSSDGKTKSAKKTKKQE